MMRCPFGRVDGTTLRCPEDRAGSSVLGWAWGRLAATDWLHGRGRLCQAQSGADWPRSPGRGRTRIS